MAVSRSDEGWESLLETAAWARIEREALPAFLRKQRWYAGKARQFEGLRLIDAGQPEGFPPASFLALVEVRHREGDPEVYFLPLGLARDEEAARLARESPGRVISAIEGFGDGAILYDALGDSVSSRVLLTIIEEGLAVPTREGQIQGLATAAFSKVRGLAGMSLEVIRGNAEQSNSAVLFDRRLLLKVFRRIEPGINPDFEIGRFLSERTPFDRIPQTAGAVEYQRRDAATATLCILQNLVPNEGTGWEHALHELKHYYEQADRRPLPDDLVPSQASPLAHEIVGDYLKAAATLGRRTAELHRALASDPRDPSFAPEPLAEADVRLLGDGVRDQFGRMLAALEANLEHLPPASRLRASRVLDGAPRLTAQLDALRAMEPGSTRIRCHGDYHLGQVLRTGDDFVILDFEGEPAKTLEQRRRKEPPIKDVVGMLRSFDYAAWAGLFAFTADRPDDFEPLSPRAKFWADCVSAAFLREYRAAARGAAFLPADPSALATLLRAFTLDKALYEVLYELNNRPDWVRIPLEGILHLVAV